MQYNTVILHTHNIGEHQPDKAKVNRQTNKMKTKATLKHVRTELFHLKWAHGHLVTLSVDD